jgi:hypothetical protein
MVLEPAASDPSIDRVGAPVGGSRDPDGSSTSEGAGRGRGWATSGRHPVEDRCTCYLEAVALKKACEPSRLL